MVGKLEIGAAPGEGGAGEGKEGGEQGIFEVRACPGRLPLLAEPAHHVDGGRLCVPSRAAAQGYPARAASSSCCIPLPAAAAAADAQAAEADVGGGAHRLID